MNSRKHVVSSIASTTLSSYAAAVVAVARGIVFASALGPALYGTWSVASTLQTLSQFADFGVSQVAVREMPRRYARGEHDSAVAYARSSFCWMGLMSVVTGAVVAALWTRTELPRVAGGWVLLPLLFVGMNATTVGVQVARAFLGFHRVAIVTPLAGCAGLAAGWVFIRVAGLPGLVFSQGAVYFAASLPLIAIAGLASMSRGWDSWRIRQSIASGWQLLLPMACAQLFVSLDVLVAGWLLGPEETGYYAVALLSSSLAAGVLANSIGSVVGQYVLRDSGRQEGGSPRDSLVWGPASAVAIALAFACTAGVLVGPLLLRTVLPGFASAAAPMIVLLVAAYYFNAQAGFTTTLVATGRQLYMVPVLVVLSALNVLADVLLVRAGLGIVGVAVGTLVANVVYACVHMALIARTTSGATGRVYMQAAATLGAGFLPVAAALVHSGAAGVAARGALRSMTLVGLVGLVGLGLGSCVVLGAIGRGWYGDVRGTAL